MASNPQNTNITPPRVQFLDPRTGAVSREWYLFFLSLFNLTGSGGSSVTLEDLQIGPTDSSALLYDHLSVLQDYAETLPASAPALAANDDVGPAYAPLTPPDDLAPVPQPTWGATGTFTTADAKTVKVTNGLIVSIT